jgi:hypothetical protein
MEIYTHYNCIVAGQMLIILEVLTEVIWVDKSKLESSFRIHLKNFLLNSNRITSVIT